MQCVEKITKMRNECRKRNPFPSSFPRRTTSNWMHMRRTGERRRRNSHFNWMHHETCALKQNNNRKGLKWPTDLTHVDTSMISSIFKCFFFPRTIPPLSAYSSLGTETLGAFNPVHGWRLYCVSDERKSYCVKMRQKNVQFVGLINAPLLFGEPCPQSCALVWSFWWRCAFSADGGHFYGCVGSTCTLFVFIN